jgi:hypothetical protein
LTVRAPSKAGSGSAHGFVHLVLKSRVDGDRHRAAAGAGVKQSPSFQIEHCFPPACDAVPGIVFGRPSPGRFCGEEFDLTQNYDHAVKRKVTNISCCVYFTEWLVTLAGRSAVVSLERAYLHPNPIRHTWIDDSELPLQRIYACEQNRASELLLTQPFNGQGKMTSSGSPALREMTFGR